MTCISAPKCPKKLKMASIIASAILYHPVLQYICNLIFRLININKTFHIYVHIKALYIESHMPPIRAPFEETLNIIFIEM